MKHTLLFTLCLALAACGVKGPLKKPSEVRMEEQKKQKALQRLPRDVQEEVAPDGSL